MAVEQPSRFILPGNGHWELCCSLHLEQDAVYQSLRTDVVNININIDISTNSVKMQKGANLIITILIIINTNFYH